MVEGQYRDAPLPCTVGMLYRGATRPEDTSVAIQAQLGDLVKMVKPPPHTYTYTHTAETKSEFKHRSKQVTRLLHHMQTKRHMSVLRTMGARLL